MKNSLPSQQIERIITKLRKRIDKKHSGLGLADYMFENTIVPFIRKELEAVTESARKEAVEAESAKHRGSGCPCFECKYIRKNDSFNRQTKV